MRLKFKIWDCIAALLFVAALGFLAAGFFGGGSGGDAKSTAKHVERVLALRLGKLDKAMDSALKQSPEEWIEVKGLPRDMVLYRYAGDTLQSWQGRFPLRNDAIATEGMFQSLNNPRAAASSPLADVDGTVRLHNFGNKWYLAKAVTEGGIRIIGGLEIMNAASTGPFNGINPWLALGENHLIRPLGESGGEEVRVAGEPVFKIIYSSLERPAGTDGRMLHFALLLALMASLTLLLSRRTLAALCVSLPVSLLALALFWLWGRGAGSEFILFSPAIYADGGIFYSLGGLLLINTAMTLLCISLYIARKSIYEKLNSSRSLGLWTAWVLITLLGVIVYSYVALRSIALNSNISLEIYKISSFSILSSLVYVSFVLQLLCFPMLIQMLEPLSALYKGFHPEAFRLSNRIGSSFLLAFYLVIVTATLGFRKEQTSLEVWASRLAVSRDIPLEVQLLTIEGRLAEDPVIASLSVMPGGAASIRAHLSETYLARVMQEHNVSVSVFPDDLGTPPESEALAAGSRFRFVDHGDGFVDYFGVFAYNIRGYGIRRVLVRVERSAAWRHRGYAGILGHSLPGEVLIPAQYSFARYCDGKLINYRGTYAYPLQLDTRKGRAVYDNGKGYSRHGGFTHFYYDVAEEEAVLVSRPVVSWLNYLIALLFLGLVFFSLSALFNIGRRKERTSGRNYFRSRITWLIMISLLLTLVALATVSVIFVYNRNEANLHTLMSEKVNSIQASLAANLRGISSTDALRTPEALRLLEEVGNNTNSDITLYSPDGMVMMSTAPAVFDQMLVDGRIDARAYRIMMSSTSRYHIQKERIGRARYYAMYAPVTGADGRIIAILCSPYTDESYDFETDAVTHSIMVLSLFIFLLLLTRFFATRVLALIFKPLEEMGTEMVGADLESLQHIEYDKDDEISSLVTAYNRMVDQLSDNSQKLAQAERERAWSSMARQVAHEIKNPLTPMKLQIQRIMRLKEKGDASWQEKFDEMAKVILDHIEILTISANDFSTIAKLYTEEHVEINLTALLKEEIAMFDNRENISFEFLGLPDAKVSAPKPQLTRVFVNLITNSVQALEHAEHGRILVSLRNSVKDGYYDIVFEDDGPGVAEENIPKLFTPNFTTKNGGSGLGLAISKSILDSCDATISYSRSFALGGACFTILYPKI
ncbi:MAG: hypothetical protein J5771_06175 [Bacteroidales bacterium]|nr:hypothetical protein [Bacteroidales bacterium]